MEFRMEFHSCLIFSNDDWSMEYSVFLFLTEKNTLRASAAQKDPGRISLCTYYIKNETDYQQIHKG